MSEPWAAWTPDEDAARAAAPGGFAGLLSQVQPDPDEGRTLEQVFERARRAGKPDEPPDGDEKAANLLARGYRPGAVSGLARQLADASAELAGEQQKIERARKIQERLHRDHQAGRLSAMDVGRALGDLDEGDASRAAMLARRCDRLRQQIEQTSELISPAALRDPDPVAEAVGRARAAGHEAFREATRARLAEAPPRRQPRPFASVSRGEEHTGPDCQVCAAGRELEAQRRRASSGYPEITRTVEGGIGGQPVTLTGDIIG
jgi:hypothetical protein